jgi:hypothetical protein
MNDLVSGDMSPSSLEAALQYAKELSKSDMIPKDYINKPGNILVAMQWGREIGLQPLQAMQSIAVINGRPTLWGDNALALVLASPVCEYVDESESDATHGVCRAKRRNDTEHVQVFTVEDAKKAGLWGKAGPWTTYPARMLKMRARSWALRDKFPDVMRGLGIAEEVRDTEIDITPRRENAVQIAQQTVATDDTEERERLIADMDAIADNGMAALESAWTGLTPAGRKLHGGLSEDTKARAARADKFLSGEN